LKTDFIHLLKFPLEAKILFSSQNPKKRGGNERRPRTIFHVYSKHPDKLK